MTDKEILRSCFDDVIWMAARYAHGRYTSAPGIIREAVKRFQGVFPDWEPRADISIGKLPHRPAGFPGDSLEDIFGVQDE